MASDGRPLGWRIILRGQWRHQIQRYVAVLNRLTSANGEESGTGSRSDRTTVSSCSCSLSGDVPTPGLWRTRLPVPE